MILGLVFSVVLVVFGKDDGMVILIVFIGMMVWIVIF